MGFKERLVELRNNKNLTQEKLAELLNMTRSAISLHELGKREPDHETLKIYADFFGVSIDYLLDHDPPPPHSNEEAKTRITNAISDDEELLEFWDDLKERPDLKLLFKQVRPLPDDAIKRVIRYIKMVEDSESR